MKVSCVERIEAIRKADNTFNNCSTTVECNDEVNLKFLEFILGNKVLAAAVSYFGFVPRLGTYNLMYGFEPL